MRFWWHFIWIFFLVWNAVGFVVMPFGLGETWVRETIRSPGAQDGLLDFLAAADAVWLVLGAIVVIWAQGQVEGWKRTGIACLIVGLGSAVIEWIGAETGFPFGPYKYTDNMGVRIGGSLPFTIPLAWIIIITGGRYLVAWVLPQLRQPRLFALAVGLVALITDFNLEIVAWKIRGYWVWYPFHEGPVPSLPPWQNYAAWFVLAFCFTRLQPLVPQAVRDGAFWRPIVVLILINALFLTANIVRWVRLAGE